MGTPGKFTDKRSVRILPMGLNGMVSCGPSESGNEPRLAKSPNPQANRPTADPTTPASLSATGKWLGAGVGVGMLRGAGDSLTRKGLLVSWCLVSWFLLPWFLGFLVFGFKDYWFLGFLVSKFLAFKFLGFLASRFLSCKDSEIL